MDKVNDYNPYDSILSRFDTELKILLNSVSSAEEYNRLLLKHTYTKRLLEVFQEYFKETKNCTEIDNLLKDTAKFLKTGILDYLTLYPNEFSKEPNVYGEYLNLRYPSVYKTDTNSNVIYYKQGYVLSRCEYYSEKDKTIIPYENNTKIYNTHKIYLQESGYITNKYIQHVIIYPKHCGLFVIQNPVVLPVDYYSTKDDRKFYFINARNPKLKALFEFYKVPIYEDNTMLDEKGQAKYNIRKFKKVE